MYILYIVYFRSYEVVNTMSNFFFNCAIFLHSSRKRKVTPEFKLYLRQSLEYGLFFKDHIFYSNLHRGRLKKLIYILIFHVPNSRSDYEARLGGAFRIHFGHLDVDPIEMRPPWRAIGSATSCFAKQCHCR